MPFVVGHQHNPLAFGLSGRVGRAGVLRSAAAEWCGKSRKACSNSLPCDGPLIEDAASVCDDDKPCLPFRHVICVSMHAGDFQEKAVQVTEKLIWPSLRSICFSYHSIFPKIRFKDVLLWNLDVMIAAALQTQHRPNLVIVDGVGMQS